MSDVADALVLRLEGFEGPLDLLLELARAEKLDLARISILALVDQYLAVVEGARRVRLELAADWLVMAAWLAWLKSRLLLPPGGPADEEAEQAAGNLAARLAELSAMRAAAAALEARPQLGREVFARGRPESFAEVDRSGLRLVLADLVRAYVAAGTRARAGRAYRVAPLSFWTVQAALDRLGRLVGGLPRGAWLRLDELVPGEELRQGGGEPDREADAGALRRRAALASTMVAGLEMARDGTASLRQDAAFEPILIGPAHG